MLGGLGAILRELVHEGHLKDETLMQRFLQSDQASRANLEERQADRGNNSCRSPEKRTCLAFWRVVRRPVWPEQSEQGGEGVTEERQKDKSGVRWLWAMMRTFSPFLRNTECRPCLPGR